MTMNSKNPLAGELDVSPEQSANNLTLLWGSRQEALCASIALMRVDKMQPNFLRTITVFCI